MAALEKLRELDMYPKTRDEFRVRTSQGGAATVVACLVAIWLVRHDWLSPTMAWWQTSMFEVNGFKSKFW